jgi:hypothetical protein
VRRYCLARHTSAKSSVTTLSANQVANIFLGKANRFPDGSQAVLIGQAGGSAARDEFYAKGHREIRRTDEGALVEDYFHRQGTAAEGSRQRRRSEKTGRGDPKTIGYIEQDLVDGSVRVLLVP